MVDTITANIDCPDKIDCEGTTCIIIDGHALVHSIGKPAEAKILGDLGDTFAEAVIHLGQSYQRIVIIFHKYRRESIKSAKHKENYPNKEGHRRPRVSLLHNFTTRVVLHAVYSQTDNVIVYARYTDALLLLLAHSPKTTCSNIWMMEGTAKKNESLSGMRWAVYLVVV